MLKLLIYLTLSVWFVRCAWNFMPLVLKNFLFVSKNQLTQVGNFLQMHHSKPRAEDVYEGHTINSLSSNLIQEGKFFKPQICDSFFH